MKYVIHIATELEVVRRSIGIITFSNNDIYPAHKIYEYHSLCQHQTNTAKIQILLAADTTFFHTTI